MGLSADCSIGSGWFGATADRVGCGARGRWARCGRLKWQRSLLADLRRASGSRPNAAISRRASMAKTSAREAISSLRSLSTDRMLRRKGVCSLRHSRTLWIDRPLCSAISSMVAADSRNMPRTALTALWEKVLEGTAPVMGATTAGVGCMPVFYAMGAKREGGKGRVPLSARTIVVCRRKWPNGQSRAESRERRAESGERRAESGKGE